MKRKELIDQQNEKFFSREMFAIFFCGVEN
jgi:hypothetical protein